MRDGAGRGSEVRDWSRREWGAGPWPGDRGSEARVRGGERVLVPCRVGESWFRAVVNSEPRVQVWECVTGFGGHGRVSRVCPGLGVLNGHRLIGVLIRFSGVGAGRQSVFVTRVWVQASGVGAPRASVWGISLGSEVSSPRADSRRPPVAAATPSRWPPTHYLLGGAGDGGDSRLDCPPRSGPLSRSTSSQGGGSLRMEWGAWAWCCSSTRRANFQARGRIIGVGEGGSHRAGVLLFIRFFSR